MKWTQLSDIPDAEGFAAPFAGVHADRLIVAGGANFPGAKPWEGGAKVWYDTVFVLDQPDGQWRVAGKLPRPGGYGVSITTPEGLVCIGGSDATRHHHEVFRLSLKNDSVSIEDLPSLPKPCANLSGALLGRVIYVAGGIEKPDAVAAMSAVWTLDLDATDRGWQEIEPLPGPGRMLAAAGVQDGAFYVVGGAALKAGPDGKPVREWLRDAYRLTPGQGWQRIADPPHVSVAAPTPMPAIAPHQLWLLGGDDGAQVNTAPADHRGFPKTIYAYDTRADSWTAADSLPLGLVTTSAILWRDAVVIPGGERMPGIRSNQVWALPVPAGQESASSGQKSGAR